MKTKAIARRQDDPLRYQGAMLRVVYRRRVEIRTQELLEASRRLKRATVKARDAMREFLRVFREAKQ